MMLPVDAANYRIGHCLFGCPVDASGDNDLILRPIYALSYNSNTKSADWVAYKVIADAIGIASSKSRQPIEDEFVELTLELSDFSLEEDTKLVLSQYAPLVNFAATPYWNDVNYLSNSVARSKALNQGAWYGLEWSIRNLVNRENEVYVVTGPIYREQQEELRLPTSKPHRVPDAFFKIVITASGRSSSFILDQDLPIHVHHCNQLSSIEEIERQTGLDLFPQASELSKSNLDSRLGC